MEWYLCELKVPKNWPEQFFKLRKAMFWERQFFSIATFKWIFEIPLLNNLFIGPPAVAGRVLWIRVRPSVLPYFRPSVRKFSWDWLISFFWNSARCLGHMSCCAWQGWIFFLKKFFCPENGENGPKTGFFEFIGKFGH